MAWQDRLQTATYTPPDGDAIEFQFENVSKLTGKKTTVFEFPSVDGAFVQDQGLGARRLPLRCFFSGDDYDLQANAFEVALETTGIGRLQHPFYGTFDVVPLAIKRRDDLKDKAGQAVFDVEFVESLISLYPLGQSNQRGQIQNLLNTYNQQAAVITEQRLFDRTIGQFLETVERIEQTTGFVRTTLQDIANRSAEVSRAFSSAILDVINTANTIAAFPDLLVAQVNNLLSIPAGQTNNVTLQQKTQAYNDFVDLVTSAVNGVDTEDGIRFEASGPVFEAVAVYLDAAVASAVQSTLAGPAITRLDSVEAADNLIRLFETSTDLQDSIRAEEGAFDTGETYQMLNNIVGIESQRLVATSFNLQLERSIVTDRDRTVIDLAAELVGNTEQAVDDIININNLGGFSILEIPRGTEIRYSV